MRDSDKTPSTGGSVSSSNHGRQTSSAHFGQTIMVDYGLDRSTEHGEEGNERINAGDFAGGLDDLSHSLSPAKAHQEQDSRGRKGTVKYPSKGG